MSRSGDGQRPTFAPIRRERTIRAKADGYAADLYEKHLDRDAEFSIELPKSVQVLTITASPGDIVRSRDQGRRA